MFEQSQAQESYLCCEQNAHDAASEHGRRQAGMCEQDKGGRKTGRELSLEELLADPMMPVLWHAHGISETDVRRTISDVAARLRAGRRSAHC
jgi:hypothetical protein